MCKDSKWATRIKWTVMDGRNVMLQMRQCEKTVKDIDSRGT